MSARTVTIVQTGVANTASVEAAFRRCDTEARFSLDPQEIADAPLLVLPGVGSFGAGMATLRESGLVEPLRRRIADARPTLAVCLGLQLLAASSEESPGVAGLGVLDQPVTAFPPSVHAPQFGWNHITTAAPEALLQPGYAYFANSYRLTHAPDGWNAATSDHGGPFIAALHRGPILACQFHPELSGPWGIALLNRWLIAAAEAAPC